MSNTRRRPNDEDDAFSSQERYCSSAAYEPGLMGNLVSKRCKAIRRPEDRALIYWLQQLSHQEGGLRRVAEEVVAMFPERMGTQLMHKFAASPGATYSAEQVRQLWGERRNEFRPYSAIEYCLDGPPPPEPEREPVATFIARCRSQAEKLPEHLKRICLDPGIDLEDETKAGVWWFHNLVGALHEYRLRSIATAEKAIAKTEISQRIFDVLDYAMHAKGLVIIEGEQRTGKSTAAANWCALHPGKVIYVKLESGIDEATFFRCIARALGTACSIQRKPHEMRMRIEDVLQEGHLALVIDEAHFLWGQTIRPRSAPMRVDWLRTALLDHGVPVALISTPQFERQCTRYEKHLEWNAKQIKGRVKLHVVLPSDLPEEDLSAVARLMAPAADEASLMRLVGFAQASDDYLAGIERLVCRATFFAAKEGRNVATSAEIKRALDEAMPRLQPSPAPPIKARKTPSSARAIALQSQRKPLSAGTPSASAKRSELDLSAHETEGLEADANRLQFTGKESFKG